MTELTLAAVRAAARRLADVAQRTPVETSRGVSSLAGVETLLKCEHLQRTGSFKIRGAYNRIAQLTAAERRRGVVCASAGNHAQGVALSAALAAVDATVFMPVTAPLPKVEATRGYGAHVMLVGDTLADAYDASMAWAERHDAVYVHPYEHPDVIAGQGTIALELDEQIPDLATVVVPIGGGGLISGIAVALAELRPDVTVIGVQAAGAASFPPSLAAGHPVTLSQVSTIADGIAVGSPGDLTLALVRAHVDRIIVVSDEAIARAVLLLVERAKQVVEPAGAAAVAALLSADPSALPEPVCVVLGGGNVDPLLLGRIISSGMYEEGRYLVVHTRLEDRPGALSRLLAVIADTGANIVAVSHHRLGMRLRLLEVEIKLELETRGPDHIAAVTRALAAAGYPLDSG